VNCFGKVQNEWEQVVVRGVLGTLWASLRRNR